MRKEPKKNSILKEDDKTKEQDKVTPTIPIDLEGNPQDLTRQENQPIDWIRVKPVRRKLAPRIMLSNTINNAVTDEVEKHIEEKKRREERIT